MRQFLIQVCEFLTTITILGLFVFAIFCVGAIYERDKVEKEAVERGFAFFEVDVNKNVTFKWKERDNK